MPPGQLILTPFSWRVLVGFTLPGSSDGGKATTCLAANGWYPHVVGPDKSRRETDKLAGRTRRLFVQGQSKWEVEFRKVGEK